jgi:hypothetical protein
MMNAPAMPLSPESLRMGYAGLPPARRVRIVDAFLREAAAERIREAYPALAQRFVLDAAYRETAALVNAEMKLPLDAGGFVVTPRFVQAVLREGR